MRALLVGLMLCLSVPASAGVYKLSWSGTNPAMGDTGTAAFPKPCPTQTDSLLRITQLIKLKPCVQSVSKSARWTMKGQPFVAYATADSTCPCVVTVWFCRVNPTGSFFGRQRSILKYAIP